MGLSMKNSVDILKKARVIQNGFPELFTTFVEICYAYKNTCGNPLNAVEQIELITKYQSTKDFLVCMLELIYSGHDITQRKFCSKFKLAMCIREAKTDEEVGELILASELIKYFAIDDRSSLYSLLTLIGGSELRNRLVPDAQVFVG